MEIDWLVVGLGLLTGLLVWQRKLIRSLIFVIKYGLPGTVNRISLVETAQPAWRRRRKVNMLASQFAEHGFKPLGVYRIPELHDTLFWSFRRHSDGMIGALTEHPFFGCSADIVVAYADGSSLTVTNNALCAGLEHMPKYRKHVFERMQIAGLVQFAEANRGDGEVAQLDKDGLVRHALIEYQEEMAWRNNRGGLSADEVSANLAAGGERVDANTAQQVARMSNARDTAITREQCKLAGLESSALSLADYEEILERVIVVLKTDSAKRIVNEICTAFELDTERYARLRARLFASAATPSETFDAEFDELFAGGHRLANVERPAAATVYVLPQEL